MSEMSNDTPPLQTAPNALSLRREALLPNERSRGLGTVAVVCTMAGVASGLALATTLMAMQVADTMAVRTCSYRTVDVTPVELGSQGFLGIRYVFAHGTARVDTVLPGTPAERIGLAPGDKVLSVNGDRIDSSSELQELISLSRPGTRARLVVERNGREHTLHPTLTVRHPSVLY